ncbi:universal stress protein [Blastococcus litoris]|uniref:universal stress protein n=1 Tax=Blastococcus litoris TaxID=2171622 RepID=UPI000E304430|nr:universal stress protein [Blastococcus litoris]
MTTSTPTAPLGGPAPAATEDGSAREIVVGVDGSEVGLGAVRWAAREAVRRNAPLRLLHAAPYLGTRSGGSPPPELPRARRITAQAYTVARHTDPAVQASTEVVPGDPTDALLRAAASGQLVVLGSLATGAPDELVLANVAVRVAARSPQPVVLVPRPRSGEPNGRPTVAVLGVGAPEDDEAVATFAAESAGANGGDLTVVQTRTPGRGAAAGWVDDDDRWRERYPELTVTRTQMPHAGADRLLAATCPTPLLVISAGSGSLLHRKLDGSHLRLMRHCTSPMALIPPVHRRREGDAASA